MLKSDAWFEAPLGCITMRQVHQETTRAGLQDWGGVGICRRCLEGSVWVEMRRVVGLISVGPNRVEIRRVVVLISVGVYSDASAPAGEDQPRQVHKTWEG